MFNFILLFIPVVFLVGSVVVCVKKFEKGKSAKSTVLGQIFAFIAVFAICACFPIISSAAEVSANVAASANGMGYLGAAISTGLSCIGGGVAVASAASSAIGATSEDSKNFGKSIVFVALGEGIALYGMLISIMIISKL